MDKDALIQLHSTLQELETEFQSMTELLEPYLGDSKPVVIEAIDDVENIETSLAAIEDRIRDLRFMIIESLP